MSTLAALKARIADDLARTDLTGQVASAIEDAITYYQTERFYFNETRSATFSTVAAQSVYSSSDDSDIPLFIAVDAMMLEDSSQSYVLQRYGSAEMESLLDASAPSGRPYAWTYWARTFRFYPIPDAVYTVRPTGLYAVAAPASDGEASNVWMTEAFELLRCRAKLYLYAHIVFDNEKAAVMKSAENDALSRLRSGTSKRVASGRIVATQF